MNVPRLIAKVIGAGQASKRDLDEFYGVRDLYDLVEIIDVMAYNRHVSGLNAES